MPLMVSRRVFVGSAALASVGAGSYGLFAQTPGAITRSPTVVQDDPILKEIRRQLRRATQGLKKGSGEGARQYASALRLWAARGQGDKIDDRLRVALQRTIAQRGRSALLAAEAPHTEMERQAADLGFTPDMLDLHRPSDPALREQALDRLLRDGLTATIHAAADLLDTVVAPRLDEIARSGGTMPVVLRRAQAPGSATCQDVCNYADAFRYAMDVACAAAIIFPPLAEACMLAASAWLGALGACIMCQVFGG
jgi:hypothetical protein